MHSVGKGETWESIAASHGVSVVDLRAANPDVKKKKLKKGTLLIVPKAQLSNSSSTKNTSEQRPSPLRINPDGTVSLIRTSISDLEVGVLLPLADKRMLEFYRGLLMAADRVRKKGVNLDIHAWDSGTTTAKIEPLLAKVGKLDILFGPAIATQVPMVAETCREKGVRLVLPFFYGQPLENYPLVYNATAPSTVLFEAAAQKLMSYFADKNFVIVRSGNAAGKGKNLSEAITKALTKRTGAPRTLELEGDDFAYESALNQFRDNMIVLDDSKVSSLKALLSHLKEFRAKHPQYRLSLLGFDDWQDEINNFLNDFFALDTYIISPYYYNEWDDKVRNFEKAYTESFHMPVAQNNPRLAALGFDLGCYFLGGLSAFGNTFEKMQGDIQQEPYQNRFRFERGASAQSFSNNFVQFVHFTPENKIELVR